MAGIDELLNTYFSLKDRILRRIEEFKGCFGDRERVFKEFVFCLLTPSSRAKNCWRAVERLWENGAIWNGGIDDIEVYLEGVRFRRRKAEYILEARTRFFDVLLDILDDFQDPFSSRRWLVEHVRGYGYKEASHFLRNIGKGLDLAILDRHIMRGLEEFGVIDGVPGSLTKRKYLEIEEKMRRFSKECGIPMAHLDLLLWYMRTGEIFK